MNARWLFALAAVFAAGSAYAHEARPVFVQLTQHADGAVDAEWRVPRVGFVPGDPKLELGPDYAPTGEIIRADFGDSIVFTARFSGGESLAGQTIALRYPTVNPGLFTLMRVTLADGAVHSQLLAPDEPAWTFPIAPSRTTVLTDYTALGVRHIVGGIDHLLFVACLVLLAGTFKRTLITVTGFTIAHSITLALATLGVLNVPGPPVEAVIALSVLFCARELALPGRDSIMRRYPVIVSTAFGLLHGFGFASALRATGLPAGEIPTALLSFNLGVELGQIAFVSVIWTCLLIARAVAPNVGQQASPENRCATLIRQPAVYAVGTVSAFWVLSRISAIWSA